MFFSLRKLSVHNENEYQTVGRLERQKENNTKEENRISKLKGKKNKRGGISIISLKKNVSGSL